MIKVVKFVTCILPQLNRKKVLKVKTSDLENTGENPPVLAQGE